MSPQLSPEEMEGEEMTPTKKKKPTPREAAKAEDDKAITSIASLKKDKAELEKRVAYLEGQLSWYQQNFHKKQA